MATSTEPETGATDREIRAEIPSLDALQHRRRQLVRECAPLSAKFGGSRGQGSPMDSIRKRHRSLIMLERLANADPRHIEFCEALEKECARYELLQDDIKSLNEQIQSRLAELYAYNKEIGLQ